MISKRNYWKSASSCFSQISFIDKLSQSYFHIR